MSFYVIENRLEFFDYEDDISVDIKIHNLCIISMSNLTRKYFSHFINEFWMASCQNILTATQNWINFLLIKQKSKYVQTFFQNFSDFFVKNIDFGKMFWANIVFLVYFLGGCFRADIPYSTFWAGTFQLPLLHGQLVSPVKF